MMDYYKILGVRRDATMQEIENAYRNILSFYDSDSNSGSYDPEICINATEAYEVLKNVVQRVSYNRLLEAKQRADDAYTYLKPKAYFLRWKVPVAVVGSFLLIRHFSLQLFQDPSAAETYISWVTGLFVFGGWILVWIARFNSSIEELMNRDISGEYDYTKLESKYFGKKAIEIAFICVCAGVYGLFLRFCVPYAPVNHLGHGNPMHFAWTDIYLLVFLVSYLLTS